LKRVKIKVLYLGYLNTRRDKAASSNYLLMQ